ncbi:hypothetical protein HK405_013437 [Cladochytrium tenue]|nr:hypothetical protein HK405_013437 [Cladochytrium tenue]
MRDGTTTSDGLPLSSSSSSTVTALAPPPTEDIQEKDADDVAAAAQAEEDEFEEHVRQQRVKRLHFLLGQAGVYSRWLAEQLQRRQTELAERRNSRRSRVDEIPAVGTAVAAAAGDTAKIAGNDDRDTADNAGDADAGEDDLDDAGTRRRSRRTAALASTATSVSAAGPPRKRAAPLPEPDRPVKRGRLHKDPPLLVDREVTASEEAPRKRGRPRRKVDNTDELLAAAAAVVADRQASSSTATATGVVAGSDSVEDEEEAERRQRQPSLIVNCVMRDYQLVGLDWLVSLWEQGLNGILADEMGLGKTLQAIALLAHLREQGVWGPFLIVCPLSTLANWVLEIQRFAPSMNVLLYHGTPPERAQLRAAHLAKVDESFPIVVTSYDLAVIDTKYLQSANRLILTGTPLQNNLSELWSLLNFLMPSIFESIEDFEKWFEFGDLTGNNAKDVLGKETTLSLATTLHEVLKPFLLRRVKAEVAIELPQKKEFIVYAPLSAQQKELYAAVLEGPNGLRSYLLRGGKPAVVTIDDEEKENTPVARYVNSQNLRMAFKQLLKVCNHPYLFYVPDEDRDQDFDMHAAIFARGGGKRAAAAAGLPDIVASSGKMVLLERLLPELLRCGHKVLVFSQMTRVLDLLADWFEFIKGWPFFRLDGNVAIEDRKEQIALFNQADGPKLFLLSTRAGGLGINLTAADTVIIYDSDWNPQMDLQAQDRVHRIGQTRPVVVYRLATKGTIEERVLDRAASKRRLEKLVIHQSEFKGDSSYYMSQRKASMDEMAAILREEAAAREAFVAAEAAAAAAASKAEGASTVKSNTRRTPGRRAAPKPQSPSPPKRQQPPQLAPTEVISDADLERLMDRSSWAALGAGSGDACCTTPSNGNRGGKVLSAAFKEVQPEVEAEAEGEDEVEGEGEEDRDECDGDGADSESVDELTCWN